MTHSLQRERDWWSRTLLCVTGPLFTLLFVVLSASVLSLFLGGVGSTLPENGDGKNLWQVLSGIGGVCPDGVCPVGVLVVCFGGRCCLGGTLVACP